MKIKYLKSFSYFLSIVFLVFFTILLIFFFLLSIKPIKINFVDYFDRESQILKETNLKEVGDIYLSFNRKSKNFELLIEDLVLGDSYFKSTQMNLDFKLSRDFFDTSLKIYDADFTIRGKNNENDTLDYSNALIKLKEKFDFINKFNVIEIINSKLLIDLSEDLNLNYLIDLKIKNERIFGIISELDNVNNYLSFDLKKTEDINSNFEIKNFNIDFVELMFGEDLLDLKDLRISGSSKSAMLNETSLGELKFDFFLDGELNYETNNIKKKIIFERNNFDGSLKNNKLEILLGFNDKESQFAIGLNTILNEDPKPNFYLKIDSIYVKNLLNVWPKGLANSVYFWMKKNSNGLIDNVRIDIESKFDGKNIILGKVDGTFECNNIEIQYMDSMPSIKNIYGNAKMENSRVFFDINSGNSNNLQINRGTVDLYDLDSETEKADINLNISSVNADVVKYLDLTEINKSNFAKLKKIDGNTVIDLNLKFPLFLDLKAEQINYNAEAEISNGFFNNVFKDFSINDLKLNIKVKEDLVKYDGEGFIENSFMNFDGEQISEENKIFDKINGKIDLEGQLLEKIIKNQFSNYQGSINLNFSYIEDEKTFKIEGIGELDNFYAESDFLGENLDFTDGKIRFIVSPFNNKYSGFIDLKTKNVILEIDTIFDDLEVKKAKIPKFVSPKQDFNLIYEKDKDANMKIRGRKLKISEIKFEEDSFFSELSDLKLDLEIDELFISDSKFTSPRINFLKNNNKFENLFVELLGDKDYHKIQINQEQDKKIFLLESNYAPGFLKLFDVDLKINTGSLKIKGEKNMNSIGYKGIIAGKDFVLLDAPFLADFISLFSLKGLAQKLKDGGIIFEDLNAKYEFSDGKLRIIDSLIKGSELGIQFDSVVGFDNDYFLTTGSIIPAYTINTLLTKFPIVGEIITAGSPEDGLIGAKFKVEKIEGEYDISYNPISVFVPNVIKNFLGD